MHYGRVINNDVANGEGVRVTLFVSGCTNHCEKCFQPQTWDFEYGELFTPLIEDTILDMLAPSHINGLTLLGGEPFEPQNQRGLLPLIWRIRRHLPEKTIWAYSGFTYEELTDPNAYCHCDATDRMLSMIDVLVDGRYVDALRDISLRFRGSSNQRLIDLRATQSTGVLTLLRED